MGRPPTNGGPSFRFNPVEVGEMDAILHAYKCAVPGREILEALAQRFSSSAERAGKMEVSVKQVLNWFQNRRYALRAKAARSAVPGQVNMSPVPNQAVVNTVAQAPQLQTAASAPASVRSMPQVPQTVPAPPAAQSAGRNASENSQMEFEAKSARDGAWYDIACFLSYRSLESGNPEALVRLAGFGEEEDEWVNIRRNVRQRSLPCESSECVAVLPGDLVLCFQEGKDQALYFDAHVLDAQRRRHDIRGCRCRFLVRYDHDQSEEIVPLRKICRRPETDYRLQQLYARSANANPQKTSTDARAGTLPAAVSVSSGTMQNNPAAEDRIATVPMIIATTQTNVAAAATSGPMTSVVAAATSGPMTSVAAAATIAPMASVAAAATIESMTNVVAAVTTGAVTNSASHTIVAAAVTAGPMTNVAAAGTTRPMTGATIQTNVSAAGTTGLMNDGTTQTNIVAAGPMNDAITQTNVVAAGITEPMNDATTQTNVTAAGTTGLMVAASIRTNLAAAATTRSSTAPTTHTDLADAATGAQSVSLNHAKVDSDSGNAASVAPANKNPSHAPAMVSADVSGGSNPSLLQQG